MSAKSNSSGEDAHSRPAQAASTKEPDASSQRHSHSAARRPGAPDLASTIASLSLSSKSTDSSAPAEKPAPKPMPKPMPNPLASNLPHGAPTKIAGSRSSTTSSKPVSKPMPNPFASSVSAAPFIPKGFSNVGGKFANSATADADVGESAATLQSLGSNVHRKPRFKQVLPTAKAPPHSRRGPPAAELHSLLDDVSEEPEQEGGDDHEAEDKELIIDGLLPRLLPHQRRGVRFMARREHGRKYTRGGLLADDMGLGKTIQSIALILYRPPETPDAPKTTLVVTPLAVMDQWKDEILQMAPKLRVGTHQGPDRTKSEKDFEKFDVLVTTYEVVSRDHQVEGPLFRINWHRIVADEAHAFRGAATKVCEAMAALKSDGRRWALTGTPLHNKLIDLYPLFRFIGVPGCHSLKGFEGEFVSDPELKKLKRQLRVLMLRRTQKVLKSFLPPMNMHSIKVQLTPMELKVYDSWRPSRVATTMSTLVLLVRMRQACDGLLNPGGHIRVGWSDDDSPLVDVEAIQPENLSKLGRDDALETGKIDESEDLADLLNVLSIEPKADEKTTFPGHRNSKIQEVRSILLKERTRKTVLFSSFVTMLVSLRPMLDFEGIKYLQYDGSLRADQRREMLAKFRDEKSNYTVLLCSLQTASVGLNLTSASQVIMVDPWWNPQIVDQAIKRVHRLGQVREVDCYQLFAQDALDERMMYIQDVKRQLARNLIDGSAQLNEADKRFLLYGDTSDEDAEGDTKSAGHGSGDKTRVKGAIFGDKSAATPTTDINGDAKKAGLPDDVNLPWAPHRSLPRIPKHKKLTS